MYHDRNLRTLMRILILIVFKLQLMLIHMYNQKYIQYLTPNTMNIYWKNLKFKFPIFCLTKQ